MQNELISAAVRFLILVMLTAVTAKWMDVELPWAWLLPAGGFVTVWIVVTEDRHG